MKRIIASIFLLFCIPVYALTTQLKEDHVVMTSDQFAITESSSVRASDTFPLGPYENVSIQCRWSGVGGSGATYRLENSNDETNWDAVSGTSTVTTGDGGSSTMILDPFPVRFGRIRVTSSAGSGNLDCIAIAQGR